MAAGRNEVRWSALSDKLQSSAGLSSPLLSTSLQLGPPLLSVSAPLAPSHTPCACSLSPQCMSVAWIVASVFEQL